MVNNKISINTKAEIYIVKMYLVNIQYSRCVVCMRKPHSRMLPLTSRSQPQAFARPPPKPYIKPPPQPYRYQASRG